MGAGEEDWKAKIGLRIASSQYNAKIDKKKKKQYKNKKLQNKTENNNELQRDRTWTMLKVL